MKYLGIIFFSFFLMFLSVPTIAFEVKPPDKSFLCENIESTILGDLNVDVVKQNTNKKETISPTTLSLNQWRGEDFVMIDSKINRFAVVQNQNFDRMPAYHQS